MASIAVDVMSGDCGAPECMPGALRALVNDPALELILVGDPAVIEPALRARRPACARARRVHPAASVVGMSEHPREAIRRRKDSSMRIAIDLVKEGRAAGMVSAGNTGALTAMAHFVLKTVGPVERAPIMSSVPARNGGHTHILDLGANSKASRAAARAVRDDGLDRRARRVRHRQSARRPAQHRRRRIQGPRARAGSARADPRDATSTTSGFVEGHDIFDEKVDVVVTDGFTGNVALKTMEGLAKLIVEQMRTEFSRDAAEQALGLASPSGAAPGRRRARPAPLQRRLHGRTHGSRGKKPRQRGPRRIRPGDRHGGHRDAARTAGGHCEGAVGRSAR